MYIEWPLEAERGFHGAVQRIVLELKILHNALETTLAEGLQQTAGYADQCGAEEAHLLIFDRRPHVAWEDKIWQRHATVGTRHISVWGM